jgi:hypothetical protein
MKKIFASLFVVFAVGVAFAAQDTITAQDATKTGLEGFRTKVNANFGRIPSSIATNVAQQVAAITATASVATWTTNIITYLDGSTNAVSSTNIIPATLSVTVVNGGVVVTNVSIQTKSP